MPGTIFEALTTLVKAFFLNNEIHEKAWGGLASTTYFLTTKKHKKTRKFFKVVALR